MYYIYMYLFHPYHHLILTYKNCDVERLIQGEQNIKVKDNKIIDHNFDKVNNNNIPETNLKIVTIYVYWQKL